MVRGMCVVCVCGFVDCLPRGAVLYFLPMRAAGNVGPYLHSGPTETFFSRDAGYSWTKVADGDTTYEFADHGGLILSAPFGKKTTTLRYAHRTRKREQIEKKRMIFI